MSNISNKATIHPTAQIGENVEIGDNAFVGENVIIGNNVKIYPNAYVEHCEIKEGAKIFPYASIGTDPQDLGYKGEATKSIIGKNTIVREYATVNRAAGEGNNTIVGDDCLLMTSCHVAHNCKIGNNVIMANLATLGGHCVIGNKVFLGGMAVIHQNVRVGQMAIMGGASASRQDIPPFAKADGRPSIIAGLNSVGLKRAGMSLEDRTLVKKAYKLLWFGDTANKKIVLENIEADSELNKNKYVMELVEFIKTSVRGVI